MRSDIVKIGIVFIISGAFLWVYTTTQTTGAAALAGLFFLLPVSVLVFVIGLIALPIGLLLRKKAPES